MNCEKSVGFIYIQFHRELSSIGSVSYFGVAVFNLLLNSLERTCVFYLCVDFVSENFSYFVGGFLIFSCFGFACYLCNEIFNLVKNTLPKRAIVFNQLRQNVLVFFLIEEFHHVSRCIFVYVLVDYVIVFFCMRRFELVCNYFGGICF